MSKPVLILTVATSFGEVDWILPALVRFREENPDWRIVTMFGHKTVYEIFRANNPTMFREFSAVSDLDVVPQEMDALFREIDPAQVRLILKDFNPDEYAPCKEELRRRCPEAVVVSYPHSTYIYGLADDPMRECPDPDAYSRHDFFLLASEHDVPAWSHRVDTKKIHITGYPRYDPWWVERLAAAPEVEEARAWLARGEGPVFFHVSRGPHPLYLSEEDYRYLTTAFMDEAMAVKGARVLIKTHPRQDVSGLCRLLAPYDPERWAVTGLHLVQGAHLADVVVSGWSSGILDALAAGKPVIEFWRFGGRDPDCRRDAQGNFTTTYRELGLAAPADSRGELAPLMEEALRDPDGPRWRAQKEAFGKICRQKDDASGGLARFLAAAARRREPGGEAPALAGLKRAMLARVDALAAAGEDGRARRWLEFMAGEFPDDPEVAGSLGVALFNCGEFARAVDVLSRTMQEHGSREAAVNLVNVLLLLDKDREACDVAMSFALGLPEAERAGFMRELSRVLGPELFGRMHGEAANRYGGAG